MSRLIACCLFAWWLPLAATAQLISKFEPGSYVMQGDDKSTHTGQLLRLRKSGELQVKNAAGQTALFGPMQVLRFQLGSRRFVAIGGFYKDGERAESVFAQQLDSGKLVLLRCFYPATTGPGGLMMSAGGGMVPTGGGTVSGGHDYLLQRAGKSDAVVVPPNGHQLSMMLEPFFRSRPDLVQLLAQNRITRRNLAEAVRAFNHDLPFMPPPAPVD